MKLISVQEISELRQDIQTALRQAINTHADRHLLRDKIDIILIRYRLEDIKYVFKQDNGSSTMTIEPQDNISAVVLYTILQ